ncbi:MAG: SRPBCC family protein [Gammaproteobacteria bacterium]|nr:SRPBCC family protein [Gammaproteobacteria bacterium]
MKIARRILVGLAGIIAILVVVGLFLPSSVHVERSAVINAPATTVYGIVSDFSRFNEWSPWYDLDPGATYTISKSSSGEGATFAWQSDDPSVGSGSQQIIALEENRLVRIKLDFGPQGIAMASYALKAMGDERSRITWTMDTDFGFDLFARYIGLMFEAWVGADYERGLAKLKTVAEKDFPATSDGDS